MICRRASSTANNPNALMRRRKRLDSECEVCYSWLDQRLSIELTSALIPEVLHKSLQEEPIAPSFSSCLFDYACSFRLIRFWISLLSPFVYYAEVAITIALMLKKWLLNAPKCGLFLLQQLCRFADALLLGVEESSSVRSTGRSTNWKYAKNQNISTKIKQKQDYSLNDLDSFECLQDQLVLNELILIDYYTSMSESNFCNDEKHKLLDDNYAEPNTSKFEKQVDNQRQIESQTNDSGISLGLNSNGSPTSSGFSIKDGELKSLDQEQHDAPNCCKI
uniref:Uncharacterized protein n=1 Tax=Meloidogyne hapla TaxID=6305 RepID=A0A1I8BNF5_MELHA